MRYKPLLIFVILLSVFMAACDRKTTTLTISGSTTVLPVVSRAAEHFRSVEELRIIVNAGGSGVGINQLGEGKIDIAMASREITQSEISRYSGVEFVTHSIGKDAVVPVVSSEIYAAGVQALSFAQIGEIYQGKISNWLELGGPDREILVIDKEGSRGTRHVFMDIVMGDKNAKAPGADLVMGSNNEEQTAIVQSDAAIGMLSHAWLNQDINGLSIRMQDGSLIAPTIDNIVNGTFPIIRELYLITNGKPQGKGKAFIDFVLSPAGQKIVEQSDYVSIFY